MDQPHKRSQEISSEAMEQQWNIHSEIVRAATPIIGLECKDKGLGLVGLGRVISKEGLVAPAELSVW